MSEYPERYAAPRVNPGPPPLSLPDPGPPKVFVEQVGRWRWRVWVEAGFMRIQREWGTYAFTKKRAIRKGEKLLAWWERCEKLRATREQVR